MNHHLVYSVSVRPRSRYADKSKNGDLKKLNKIKQKMRNRKKIAKKEKMKYAVEILSFVELSQKGSSYKISTDLEEGDFDSILYTESNRTSRFLN